MKVESASISLPKNGELENGDRAYVRTDRHGTTVFAVVDGLGHGPRAAEVSQRAAQWLDQTPLNRAAHELMAELHQQLVGTRGAAATLCVLSPGIVSACAVGNVACRALGMQLPLVFSAGILGVQVRKFRSCQTSLEIPVRFMLFSDGISSRAPLADMKTLSPRQACEAVVENYRRLQDDSTVLIVDVH